MEVLRETLLQPPNRVFGAIGAPFGGFILLGVLLAEFFFGLAGLLLARILKRIRLVFAILGIVIMASAVGYPVLILMYGNQEEDYFEVPEREFFVGSWSDDLGQLELRTDSTCYLSLMFGNKGLREFCGTWDVDSRYLYLFDSACVESFEWEISKCNGLFFITYSHVGNPDTWDGNLGFWKVTD